MPRLDWLRTELSSYYLYQHQIVLTHILPQDSRYPAEFSTAYRAALTDNFASLLIGGHYHQHGYVEETLTNGEPIGYLATGTLKERGYVVVTVEAERVTIERLVF